MGQVAMNYSSGQNGFSEDGTLAVEWYKRASDAGCLASTVALGIELLTGEVLEKDTKRGEELLLMAAEKGSWGAAYLLASAFSMGSLGLEVDLAQAERLLVSALGSCTTHDLPDREKIHASALLYSIRTKRCEHSMEALQAFLGN